MRTRRELACVLLDQAFRVLANNVAGLRIEEALFVPPGGYRSVLGTLKHIAGWSHVYRSYAFDPEPRHWVQIDWPRGLRETIVPSQEYLDEVVVWARQAHAAWLYNLNGASRGGGPRRPPTAALGREDTALRHRREDCAPSGVPRRRDQPAAVDRSQRSMGGIRRGRGESHLHDRAPRPTALALTA